MSALTKIFVVANMVLAVALAFSGLTYFSHAHNYRALYKDAQGEVASLKQRMAEDKAAYDASRQLLTSRNDFLSSSLDTGRVLLAQMEKTHHEQSRQLREKEEGIRATFAQMDQIRQELANAHAERQTAQKERDEARTAGLAAREIQEKATAAAADFEAQWEAAQRQAKDYERKYEEASADLKQKGLVLARLKEQYGEVDLEAAVQPRIRGTVMAVDETTGVIILNVGASNQVKVGHEFSVTRGDKFVGKVKVTNVDPDWAGAVVVRGMQKLPVKLGDQAATVIE